MKLLVTRIKLKAFTYGLITAISLSLGVGVSAPAHAESQFRYWSFWQSEGDQWSLASVGVASVPVSQGAVQGWRFITSGVAASRHWCVVVQGVGRLIVFGICLVKALQVFFVTF